MLDEKAIDAQQFEEQVPQVDPASNWSEAQDRGEDLANMMDPLVQEPKQETSQNLADRFDAERESPPL